MQQAATFEDCIGDDEGEADGSGTESELEVTEVTEVIGTGSRKRKRRKRGDDDADFVPDGGEGGRSGALAFVSDTRAKRPQRKAARDGQRKRRGMEQVQAALRQKKIASASWGGDVSCDGGSGIGGQYVALDSTGRESSALSAQETSVDLTGDDEGMNGKKEFGRSPVLSLSDDEDEDEIVGAERKGKGKGEGKRKRAASDDQGGGLEDDDQIQVAAEKAIEEAETKRRIELLAARGGGGAWEYRQQPFIAFLDSLSCHDQKPIYRNMQRFLRTEFLHRKVFPLIKRKQAEAMARYRREEIAKEVDKAKASREEGKGRGKGKGKGKGADEGNSSSSGGSSSNDSIKSSKGADSPNWHPSHLDPFTTMEEVEWGPGTMQQDVLDAVHEAFFGGTRGQKRRYGMKVKLGDVSISEWLLDPQEVLAFKHKGEDGKERFLLTTVPAWPKTPGHNTGSKDWNDLRLKCPQQRNSWDCGMYVCRHAQEWVDRLFNHVREHGRDLEVTPRDVFNLRLNDNDQPRDLNRGKILDDDFLPDIAPLYEGNDWHGPGAQIPGSFSTKGMKTDEDYELLEKEQPKRRWNINGSWLSKRHADEIVKMRGKMLNLILEEWYSTKRSGSEGGGGSGSGSSSSSSSSNSGESVVTDSSVSGGGKDMAMGERDSEPIVGFSSGSSGSGGSGSGGTVGDGGGSAEVEVVKDKAQRVVSAQEISSGDESDDVIPVEEKGKGKGKGGGKDEVSGDRWQEVVGSDSDNERRPRQKTGLTPHQTTPVQSHEGKPAASLSADEDSAVEELCDGDEHYDEDSDRY